MIGPPNTIKSLILQMKELEKLHMREKWLA